MSDPGHPSCPSTGPSDRTGDAAEDRQPGPDPVASGAAMFTFDAGQRIRSWNRAAERLTGLADSDTVGRRCWEVLCGHDDAGVPICKATCGYARLLREHWPVTAPTMSIATAIGPLRVTVPMVQIAGAPVVAAVLVPTPIAAPAQAARPFRVALAPALTNRQRTVLALLCDGKGVRSIAAELQLSDLTVRNHIRGILAGLGCSSQLAAVAEARRLGLFDAVPAPGET